MQADSQKTSIWRRLATILTEMDSAFHPSEYRSERIASLEARVQRLEAAHPSTEKSN